MRIVPDQVINETRIRLEREPGENPGRTGHCKQGAFSRNVIASKDVRRRKTAWICKSGNLLEP